MSLMMQIWGFILLSTNVRPDNTFCVVFLINLSKDSKQIAIKTKSMNTFRRYIEEKNIKETKYFNYILYKSEYFYIE